MRGTTTSESTSRGSFPTPNSHASSSPARSSAATDVAMPIFWAKPLNQRPCSSHISPPSSSNTPVAFSSAVRVELVPNMIRSSPTNVPPCSGRSCISRRFSGHGAAEAICNANNSARTRIRSREAWVEYEFIAPLPSHPTP
ncbi:hypothetical protein CDL15_Pgr020784 [Punica granatum]|uniref:Uncharacterized protein n=1 Tax=Punica granatum TaxID=22663 RepID=A0A218XVE6_PUNGR|nr:hypothetical protein CDL15_Pgr020784 [Punica granatum]